MQEPRPNNASIATRWIDQRIASGMASQTVSPVQNRRATPQPPIQTRHKGAVRGSQPNPRGIDWVKPAHG